MKSHRLRLSTAWKIVGLVSGALLAAVMSLMLMAPTRLLLMNRLSLLGSRTTFTNTHPALRPRRVRRNFLVMGYPRTSPCLRRNRLS